MQRTMRQIFVNLPVKDLQRSKDFWASLGFGFDERFTNDKGACLVIEKDRIHAMLLTEPFGHVWELFHMREVPR